MKVWSFPPTKSAAIWFASNKTRFPFQGDFEAGKTVMVFPTCRIAAQDLTFAANGYRWTQSEKLEQKLEPVKDEDADEDDEEEEDPTPNISEVDYQKSSPENIPTVWIRQPNSQQPGTGLLRLVDGQQLVLDGSSGFRISKIESDSVTVANRNASKVIPISQILSINFPTSN